ncbi:MULTISPECIES: BTAD domain-containing putative transcriptional regulator [unclassified Streptomyces]|uniref:AfsR/SARP family transcriptional regulator n=1 Tax=unclassified Streptomyces TaxID=2593676 RepID=UPI0033AC7CE7
MEFRLFGEVHVVGGGIRVHPSSGRARTLLAALAWEPGELVPDERLIGRIWGERLPADPRDALYTCVKRLRRALAVLGGGADRVVRRHGGYLLAAEHADTDVSRFRTLVRQAREETDATVAAYLYERAIRTASGTPLVDADSSWASRVGEALERERLAARTAAAEAWLRAGRHEELLPELIHLTREQPLDEAVALLLMDALHRSGRGAEALDCYTSLRRRLVDQLGVEPGRAVRQAHQRLLGARS